MLSRFLNAAPLFWQLCQRRKVSSCTFINTSFTTAAPCVQNGKEYWFTTKEKFEKGTEEGKFLEYAYVHSNIYGTSLKVRALFRTSN